MGRAEIDGASASTFDWTTAGVDADTRFVCDPATNGYNVLVKKVALGQYQVVFGDTVIGITQGFGSVSGPLAQLTSKVAGEAVTGSGPFQCAPGSPTTFVTCFAVATRDASNMPVDGSFTITIG